MTIAYLGPEGSHSHAASKLMFRTTTNSHRKTDELLPTATFEEIYSKLDRAEIPLGVVPIENTFGGEIKVNFEKILTGDYKIFREIKLLLSHYLVVYPGSTIKDIKRILLHPQSKFLCSNYLAQHSEWEEVLVESTAEAARIISSDQDKQTATIASLEVAETYGLKIIDKHVANDPHNYTRFVAVVKELFDFPPGDADKCTLLFDLPNKPGMLQNALDCLANNANLTKIESRKIPGKDDNYRFFIDFMFSGCLDLDDFEKCVTNLKIVGIYKSGKEVKEK